MLPMVIHNSLFVANKCVDGDTSLDEGHGLSSSLEGVQQLAHSEPTATSAYTVVVQWGEFFPGSEKPDGGRKYVFSAPQVQGMVIGDNFCIRHFQQVKLDSYILLAVHFLYTSYCSKPQSYLLHYAPHLYSKCLNYICLPGLLFLLSCCVFCC